MKKADVVLKTSEHQHQVTVFEWAEIMAQSKYPMLRWLYAIPNGGARHIVVARKLKAEGVKPGVPDICLPYPRLFCGDDPIHGLYIEMKSKDTDGRVSKDQKQWLDYLDSVGYKVSTCWSADEAIEAIEKYLNA